MVKLLNTDLEGLSAAAAIVAEGGVICYPTDTVYGLGCDPFNLTAIDKTIRAKGGRTKPMPVLVRDLSDANRIAVLPDNAKKLANRFWPGPLTIVVRARDLLLNRLAVNGTVGIRSPNHPVCLTLLGLCQGLLVGTSANMTGRHPATSADEAARIFSGKIDAVLDGGKSTLGVASTVVDLTNPRLMILREGPIGRDEILKCLRMKVST